MRKIDFGLSDYRSEWSRQKELQGRLIEAKRRGEQGEEYLLIGEHPPVYTLGFHGDINNLLIDRETLHKQGCECIRIERGGDITFHGPGQLILYPIIDLGSHEIGVKQYVAILEQSVIDLLEKYGISCSRIEGATGVWLGKGTGTERKICAIGVKI